MATTLKFSSDEFKSLMAVFGMLNGKCNDITIKDGYIHQMNNKKTILYDIDLNKFFNGASIYISKLETQFALMNMFAISNNEVVLKIDDTKYHWMDKKSKIEVIIPDESELRPPYLNVESKHVKSLKNVNKKIFDTSFDRTILDRIQQSAKTLEASDVFISIDNDLAKFILIPADTLATTKMEVHKVEELNDENFSCSLKCDVTSFLLKTEELKVSVFDNKSFGSENSMTIFYNAEIERVPVNMWVLAKYVNN